MGDFILYITTLLFLFLGMFLTLIPAFPALPSMFFVSCVYVIFDRFNHLSAVDLIYLFIIMLVSLLVDYLGGIFLLKYGLVGKKMLLFTIIGGVLGGLIAPPFGALLGLLMGILFSEILLYKEHHDVIKFSFSEALGGAIGIMVNFSIAFVFIGFFVTFILK